MALSEEPSHAALQLLYKDVCNDALLTSQLENRLRHLTGSSWSLINASGSVQDEATEALGKSPVMQQLMRAVWEAGIYGHTLVEVEPAKAGGLTVRTIPRQHICPPLGRFYPDSWDISRHIDYRKLSEYGTWLLEFGGEDLGLLNKAVPHVLFRRFAMSCWSELCEIYGIPPRVMKTNVQDPGMLTRAESMMKDMGAAAWFVIDETESFEWATATTTNGDVYNNLINRCSQELSLLISGAVIGQDTEHGNRSKDESAQTMLYSLVQSDMRQVEQSFNHQVLPALARLGIVPHGLSMRFDPEPDLEKLWKYTAGFLPFYNIDATWVKETFGIAVTGERSPANTGGGNDAPAANDLHFFD